MGAHPVRGPGRRPKRICRFLKKIFSSFQGRGSVSAWPALLRVPAPWTGRVWLAVCVVRILGAVNLAI